MLFLRYSVPTPLQKRLQLDGDLSGYNLIAHDSVLVQAGFEDVGDARAEFPFAPD